MQRWVLETLSTYGQGISLDALAVLAIDRGHNRKIAMTHVDTALKRLSGHGFVGRRLAPDRPGVFTWHIAPSARAALEKAHHAPAQA